MAKNLIILLAMGLCLQAAPPRTIAEATKDFEKRDGFVPIYWDKAEGKVFLQISRWNQEFLYIASLPAGLGSNDIGLDRGLLSEPRVVAFERIGPRVLLIKKTLASALRVTTPWKNAPSPIPSPPPSYGAST